LFAAPPTVEYALSLAPLVADVEYDIPSTADAPNCKIAAESVNGKSGWLVRDPQGQAIRVFLDTNGDNKVDQWSYFKDGVEVYRDVDSDGNTKVDQHRWLNLGGTRWGIDANEDGQIDSWKTISAEEATAEILYAIRDGDLKRFQRILISPDELKSLTLTESQTQEIQKRIADAATQFRALSGKVKGITKETKWVDFGAARPGAVPVDSRPDADLVVYENAVAVYDTKGETGSIQIGTLVQVGRGWRVIDVPHVAGENLAENASSGFFFSTSFTGSNPGVAANGPNEAIQKLLAELEQVEKQASEARSPQDVARIHELRTNTLQKLIDVAAPPGKDAWIQQLADTLSAAIQSGEYPEGTARMEALLASLEKDPAAGKMTPYVAFRLLMADYVQQLQGENPDYAKIQDAWLKKLEEFVTKYPQAEDSADAMLQMATTYEFSGNDKEAKKWYSEIAERFPGTSAAEKAAGAKKRIESVGQAVSLRGKSLDGKDVDLRAFRGKLVLLHYWASWSDLCRADLAQLKELHAKYGQRGFTIIGISMDTDRSQLQSFLQKNRLPWAQIYEEGGLEGRLANELGILTIPTMMLVDGTGKVINRNVHTAELDDLLGKNLR
jgi:peroxiredoxin